MLVINHGRPPRSQMPDRIKDMGSVLQGIPAELPEELFGTICSSATVKIERIVSRGHASPDGFWYDQEMNEFVLVVKGSAGLQLENKHDLVILKAGDYLNIGAHAKHRVEWTDSTCDTIWLAVHY
jgi:cupin 2 domain-containing protein